VPMPGGTAAIRQPWRMALSYLESFVDDPAELDVFRRNEAAWEPVASLARKGLNSPDTSSAGRLFDAVAALLDVRDAVNYEGQAAIELEQIADPAEAGGYHAEITGGEPMVVHGRDLVLAAAGELRAGVPVPVIAARFHNGVAEVVSRACLRLRAITQVTTVALSGGVFQNLLLLERTVDALTDKGFEVLTHSRVPANDGGISLGQAVIAGRA
jgi:hydrogenase maturation protein HypF